MTDVGDVVSSVLTSWHVGVFPEPFAPHYGGDMVGQSEALGVMHDEAEHRAGGTVEHNHIVILDVAHEAAESLEELELTLSRGREWRLDGFDHRIACSPTLQLDRFLRN